MDASKAQKLARLQALIDAVPADGGADFGEGAFAAGSETGRPHPAAGGSSRGVEPGSTRYRFAESASPDGEPEDPGKAAWGRIVSLCSHNEFCRAKMAQRLAREGVDSAIAEEALDRAVSIGLIDDARWGEMRAAGLMRRGMGIPGIERELRGYGIDPTVVEGWPEAFSERFGAELERARAVIEAKPPKSRNPQASAYARLVRKGYAPGVASSAAASWFEDFRRESR